MLAARTLELLSRREVARWGRDFDVLLTPTSAILPPLAGAILEAQHAAPDQPVLDVVASVSFTAFGNVTGLPAVSLPLHWSEDGLPVGVQLVAGPWQDGRLLALAAQLERARPWAARVRRSLRWRDRPQLCARQRCAGARPAESVQLRRRRWLARLASPFADEPAEDLDELPGRTGCRRSGAARARASSSDIAGL